MARPMVVVMMAIRVAPQPKMIKLRPPGVRLERFWADFFDDFLSEIVDASTIFATLADF